MLTVKILVKRTLITFLALAGRLMPARRGIRILYYHSVHPHRRNETNVRPAAFERHLRHLKKQYRVVPLEEALDLLQKKMFTGKEMVVTFDDGYRDNVVVAAPLLRRYGMKAAFFLTVGYIGTDTILHHDLHDDPAANRLLSWDEAIALLREGHTIGSHTLTHVQLSSLDAGGKRKEMKESLAMLRKQLGEGGYPVSYPYGSWTDFDAETTVLAGEDGYSSGFSAVSGVNTETSDIFCLFRIGVDASDNLITFAAKCSGTLDFLALKDSPVVKKILRLFF